MVGVGLSTMWGIFKLKSRSPCARALLASAAVAAAVALAGCVTENMAPSAKALKPLSPQTVAELAAKNMPKESPILLRIFKEESELEVWKQDTSGHYALLRRFPICRWSGELGPKLKEGDRQAPEGFYAITPGQMNPNSAYYLSFNVGYPNAFDRAHGRTGGEVMVHGDCSSRGCYAMTDEQIAEIYALGREAFFGGQRSFQVQAYPFRMTPLNMARHRNNPNLPFWKNLKEGYDHFDVTHLEPKVDVCEKRYVFDAESPANATPIRFSAADRCPAYRVNPEIAAAAAEKGRRDALEAAELTRKGTPAAPIRTGSDGGMNEVFLASLRPREVRDAAGNVRMIMETRAPGTVPVAVNPPRAPERAGAESAAGTAPAPKDQVAAASADSGTVFTRWFGSGGANNKAAPPPHASPAKPVTSSGHPPTSVLVAARPQPKPPAQQQHANADPLDSPAVTAVASESNLLSGAQRVLPVGSFEVREPGVR
jgi:murein L,D-transpeptidase YafK